MNVKPAMGFTLPSAGVTRLCPTTTRCPNNPLAAQKVRAVLAEMRNISDRPQALIQNYVDRSEVTQNILSNHEKVKIQIAGRESKKSDGDKKAA